MQKLRAAGSVRIERYELLKAETVLLDILRGLNADIAEMERLIHDAGHVLLAGGEAMDEAVLRAVLKQPLVGIGVLDLGVFDLAIDIGYIAGKPGLVLAAPGGHGDIMTV